MTNRDGRSDKCSHSIRVIGNRQTDSNGAPPDGWSRCLPQSKRLLRRFRTEACARPALITIAVLVALLHLLGPAAHGQGSQADYERARSMPGLVQDKVLNEELHETWIDGSTLVYRHQSALDRWQYKIADARNGSLRDAFDHKAVAAQIGTFLGHEVEPDRLPIDRLTASDGTALIVLVAKEGRLFSIDGRKNAVTEVPIESAHAFRLAPTSRKRSRDRGGDTTMLFINRTAEKVRIVWLDRQGEPKPYATLAPGQTHRQHTFVGHLWTVTTEKDRRLGVYEAAAGLDVVVVDGVQETPPAETRPQRFPQTRRPPNLSPDGRWNAFIRDHNVVLREIETQREVRLSTDGMATNGYTNRIVWSPDATKLAVIREEPEQEHTVTFIESTPRDQVQPKLHTFQYLKPGDRIAHPRPCLFDVAARRRVEIDEALFPQPWSISFLAWRGDSGAFTFLYNQRGHQVLRLIEVDAGTGAARTVIDEQSATFIDYAHKVFLHRIEATGEAIWMSERDGWNHLYCVDMATGHVKSRITSGEWVVRGVERVDDEERQIFFRAVGVHPGRDPYHVHYGRVGFDGGAPVWLTQGDGTHQLRFAPGKSFYIDTYSRVDLPPVHELRRTSDGSLVCRLATGDWAPLRATGWRPPERFAAKGRDAKTDIWGVLFYPSNFDPQKAYPVVENIYAGPHGHFVPKAFRAWYASREIAELGFIVVRIDGMGTNWRSKTFHDVCWKNLGDSGFPDRIAWMRAAAKTRPFLDLARVGIYGGSAGGQSALRALLAHGDFYHAAVADCGCHDNRMDKIWWNELWMGWPVGPHYEAQSNVTNAHKLQGKLLLIVGELDRNVDPASTMQVADALIRADKDFELLMMTGTGHGAAETPYGRRRRQDFLVRHLLGIKPRWE